MMTLELLGVGIAPRHHRGAFGDAQIRLAQLQPAFVGQPIESLDRRRQQLGVCRERDCLGLDRGAHRDPFDVAGAQCAGRMRYPQALSQQELELATEPLPPMAEVGALVRKFVLEKLLAGEVLEIRVIDPALTHAFDRFAPSNDGCAVVGRPWQGQIGRYISLGHLSHSCAPGWRASPRERSVLTACALLLEPSHLHRIGALGQHWLPPQRSSAQTSHVYRSKGFAC